MPVDRSESEVWAKDASGILVRDGHQMSIQVSNGPQTFLDLKGLALQVLEVFEEANIRLAKNSDISFLVSQAVQLSDSWLIGYLPVDDPLPLLRAYQMDRVAKAILPLRNLPGARSYLKDMSNGSLNPFMRIRSKAKDTLWELELWSILKTMSFEARLAEPDIRVVTASGEIGLACKKVYAEKNFPKVLSEGVRQIGSHGKIGMIAVNLDDLLPAGAMVIAPDIKGYSAALSNYNLEFMQRNERNLRKYLSSGRSVAALVSTSIPGRIPNAEGMVFSSRQTAIWSLPGLAEPMYGHVSEFRDVLFNGHGP